jgi:hypothetical protein
MGRYKEVAALLPVDAAYIAGLIDGEGTMLICALINESGRNSCSTSI